MIFLDTMALLYFVNGDQRFPIELRKQLSSGKVLVSVATIWEIGIKGRSGKLDFLGNPIMSADHLRPLIEKCEQEAFQIVPISPGHASIAPFLDGDHKDPFDRIIVAQALEQDATLFSSDAALDSLSPALRRRW